MTRLSVIVITRNEAANIRECLESVRWADEIIVLDSGSTDGTQAICREYTARVLDTDWPGFGPQKNRALEQACGQWVLSIDADERVTPELRAAIERAIADPASPDVFEMPRLSSFCGREMRHSGWWPDHVARLFRRGRAHFSDDLVHERLVHAGRAGRLTHPLRHLSFRSLEQLLAKMDHYSSAGAQKLLAKGRRGNLAVAIVRGLWAFFRTYVLRAGFLDGREGFMVAVANAEGTYYRYLKLMYLSEQGGGEGPRGSA